MSMEQLLKTIEFLYVDASLSGHLTVQSTNCANPSMAYNIAIDDEIHYINTQNKQ